MQNQLLANNQKRQKKAYPLYFVHKMWHPQMLALYMVLVIVHGGEHFLQMYQAFVLDWARPASGGILGLWFPQLASSEVLHFTYNFFQLMGLFVLLGGFKGRARTWWKAAIIFQSWHFFEHVLLQVQWITGYYLFNQPQQTSLFQMFIPRIELHFIYNMSVLVPTLVAVYFYITARMEKRRTRLQNA